MIRNNLRHEKLKFYAKKLGVDEFVYLPDDLQRKFSNVPPELESIKEYAKDFERFLENAKSGDYVLIQGDFGLTCHLVNFSKSKGLIPVYATTKRISKDMKKDGKKGSCGNMKKDGKKGSCGNMKKDGKKGSCGSKK